MAEDILIDNEENASLCERILLDLDNIFKRDHNILEFDIIEIVESTCNKSPVVYIDHHLALEKWCVPHLYEYSCKKLLHCRKNNIRSDFNLLFQWSRIILLINPDFTTAWNLRRDLVSFADTVQAHLDDLKFSELVLIRKPKCASVYSYREWLLNNYAKFKKELNNELIQNELRVTLDAASRYARNYYAWSHRTWIFSVYIVNSNIDYILQNIVDDLEVTQGWLEAHISDYSCYQHRQCLFGLIFTLERNLGSKCDHNRFNRCKETFFNELDMLDALLPLYPEQESLFLHRRFLLHASLHWCPDKLAHLKTRETNFYRDILRSTRLKLSTNSWQRQLIERYLAYLRRNMDWSFEC